MRCKHCGSKMIFPDTKDKRFSTGKAVAGAVAFGLVGVTAGFIGKEIRGYRCSCCGMFSEDTMAIPEETLVDMAVNEAKTSGKSVSYERFREKYLGIEQVPTVGYGSVADAAPHYNSQIQETSSIANDVVEESTTEVKIKNRYFIRQYIKDCPVLIEEAIIKEDTSKNLLSLTIRNVSGKALRSLYLQASVYDDVGDLISEQKLVYQGVSIENGSYFPVDKEFDLQTEVAYKVTVSCEKAAFTDDSVWRKPEEATECTLPESVEITPQNFPQYKYLRRLMTEKSRLREGDPLYQPVYTENCGVCICGAPICSAEPCPVCGLTPEDIADILDYDTLIESRKALIKQRATERQTAVADLFEQACQRKYDEAVNQQEQAKQSSFEKAAQIFASLSGYKDSDKRHQECLTGIENCKKDAIYNNAVTLISKRVQRIEDFEAAIKEFQKIPNWKDANERIAACKRMIEQIEEKEEAERLKRQQEKEHLEQQQKKRKKNQRIIGIVVAIVMALAAIAGIILYKEVFLPAKLAENEQKYQYVLSHKTGKDETTYKYLRQLSRENYKDCAKIYDDLYTLRVKLIANRSKTDKTTDSVSKIKHGEKFYIHVIVSGGKPGERIDFKLTSSEGTISGSETNTLISETFDGPQEFDGTIETTFGNTTLWCTMEAYLNDIKVTKTIDADWG